MTTALLAFLLGPTHAAAQEPGTVDVTGLMYLKYEQGEAGSAEFSSFHVARSYFTARAGILPRLSARITIDAHQDSTGDFKARLKYAHIKYDVGSAGSALTDLQLEAGIAHMPWLGFEEHINLYRMRDKMFMERNGLFNSADLGVTLRGNLGGQVDEEFQRTVSDDFAGRYGSFEVGVYNGGGYHAVEVNTNKVVEGRLTLRPLPGTLPGLQLSGLAITGKGNQPGTGDDVPDWNTYNLFLSYQHQHGTLTAQYVNGSGNQKGTFVDPLSPSQATDVSGYSLFAEARPGQWRVIGGFDDFDRKPGTADFSLQRYHAGIGYVVTGGNILVLSVDRVDWDDPALDPDTRAQLVFQVKF
ncbi:MAG: hypothetical protein R6U63_06640 [Longimicrobiales bacterium]